jgi:hypothetical protein
MANKIYLIREANCYVPYKPPLAQRISLALGIVHSLELPEYVSIWCSPISCNSLVDDNDYTTFGVKLAGPMPSKEGDLYLQN